MRRLLVAVLFLMTSALAVAASPVPAAKRLERARLCYEAMDYPCAERELLEARGALAQLPHADAVAILRLSAEAALASDRRGDAETHLKALLERAPDFAVASSAWPPAWRDVLAAVRKAMPDRTPPQLSVTASGEVERGQPLKVVVRAADRSGVGRVLLHVRRGTTPPEVLALSTQDGRLWTAELVAGAEPDIALWVEAWDLASNGPATWGSAAAPRVVTVRAPPPDPPPDGATDPPVGGARPETPLVQRWWFWTLIGVGVAGTATLVYFLTRPDEDSAAPPSRGIAVELTFQ